MYFTILHLAVRTRTPGKNASQKQTRTSTILGKQKPPFPTQSTRKEIRFSTYAHSCYPGRTSFQGPIGFCRDPSRHWPRAICLRLYSTVSGKVLLDDFKTTFTRSRCLPPVQDGTVQPSDTRFHRLAGASGRRRTVSMARSPLNSRQKRPRRHYR